MCVGFRYPEAGVTEGCEPPDMGPVNPSSALQEQYMLLAAESSPPMGFFIPISFLLLHL